MSDPLTALENIGAHLKAEFDSVKSRIEEDLPTVAKAVQDAASNPVTAVLASAVHLPQAPELLQTFADVLASMEAQLAAEHAAGVTEGQQPPAEAPAATA